MATTTLQRYVRFGESEINARDPMDAGMCQRALSNLNHLADQYAQHRVQWVMHSGAFYAYAPTPAEGEWALVWMSTPFDLHLRESGLSYAMRLRMRVSSNSAIDAATFRAVVSPVGEAVSERDVAGPNTGDVAITSASYSWLAPTDLLHLDARRVNRGAESAPALDTIGGTTLPTQWLRAVLTVWGKVNGPGATPRLQGVHLSEFMP
jgi:hypothetical protein